VDDLSQLQHRNSKVCSAALRQVLKESNFVEKLLNIFDESQSVKKRQNVLYALSSAAYCWASDAEAETSVLSKFQYLSVFSPAIRGEIVEVVSNTLKHGESELSAELMLSLTDLFVFWFIGADSILMYQLEKLLERLLRRQSPEVALTAFATLFEQLKRSALVYEALPGNVSLRHVQRLFYPLSLYRTVPSCSKKGESDLIPFLFDLLKCNCEDLNPTVLKVLGAFMCALRVNDGITLDLPLLKHLMNGPSGSKPDFVDGLFLVVAYSNLKEASDYFALMDSGVLLSAIDKFYLRYTDVSRHAQMIVKRVADWLLSQATLDASHPLVVAARDLAPNVTKLLNEKSFYETIEQEADTAQKLAAFRAALVARMQLSRK